MTKRPIKDVAASIRQRLYNNAKETGRPFQEVLQYFAMERFLYRLAQSPYADKFVLKGALMFTAWRAPSSRPTKDIDLLARISNNVDAILAVVRDICLLQVEPDGLVFDVTSLRGMIIKEEADYEGVRVTFLARLQNAEVHMQLDMGFGDVLTPAATLAEYPTILDLAPPKLWGYSRETSVAEKFEAMVKLGQLNSRMKDFFDIWFMSRQFGFDGATLADAITRTFSHRGTAIAVLPLALTAAFASDPAKVAQWRGFLRKSRITSAPDNLGQIVDVLAAFLLPVARAIQEGQRFVARWDASGPWQLSSD
jgi:hypothetical protein